MPELSLLAAVIVGLLGGTHCLGMCGGIVTAFSLQTPQYQGKFTFLLAYNVGRVLSYTLAGALAGTLGASALLADHILPAQIALYVAANLMLIALGLYLAGIWRGVIVVERAGRRLWKVVQPLTGKLLPIQTLPKALAAGAVWGWLPCGLVYSVLVTAMASGSTVQGALLMLAFGLGTLPNLLAMGLAAQRLQGWMRRPWVKPLAGLTVVGFGVWGLAHALMR